MTEIRKRILVTGFLERNKMFIVEPIDAAEVERMCGALFRSIP